MKSIRGLSPPVVLEAAATGAYSQQDVAKLARRVVLRGRRGKNATAKKRSSVTARSRTTAFELAQTAAHQYLTQNATEKREVRRALLSNCTMSDGSLSVTMRKAVRRARENEGKCGLAGRQGLEPRFSGAPSENAA